MSIVDKRRELFEKHSEIAKKYNALYQKLEKAKDDSDLRMELRMIAQEAIGVLLEMKKIYEEL